MIHSPFTEKSQTPIQFSRSQARGMVEIYPEHSQGLQDLERFSHIFLLYIFHESSGYDLLAKPFPDDNLHGLFATRVPYRPNPIGLSVVRLITRKGNVPEKDGVDMLEGTPLLDIKPYVNEFDVRTGTRCGWYEGKVKLTPSNYHLITIPFLYNKRIFLHQSSSRSLTRVAFIGWNFQD